jgi:streptomycin 6-kinase
VPFDSRTDYAALTLNRTVSPQTTAFAGLSATWFESDTIGSESRANSIFVGMRHVF